jgi:hypothetical protein
MGLKNVRLHNQNNSAAVRFQRVALAGEDQAAHPGQTGDAAGGLLADKREVAVDDEQRGRVGGRRILDADGLRVPVALSRGKDQNGTARISYLSWRKFPERDEIRHIQSIDRLLISPSHCGWAPI